VTEKKVPKKILEGGIRKTPELFKTRGKRIQIGREKSQKEANVQRNMGGL